MICKIIHMMCLQIWFSFAFCTLKIVSWNYRKSPFFISIWVPEFLIVFCNSSLPILIVFSNIRLHIHPLTINKRKEISYYAIWRLYISSISYGYEKIKKLKSLIIRQSFDCLWKLCRYPNYIEHTNKFEQIKTPPMEETAKFLSVGFSTFGASSKARIII